MVRGAEERKRREGKGKRKEKKRKSYEIIDREIVRPSCRRGGGTKGMCSYEYLQSVIMASPPVSRVNKTKLLYVLDHGRRAAIAS